VSTAATQADKLVRGNSERILRIRALGQFFKTRLLTIARAYPEILILGCYAIIVYDLSLLIGTKFTFPSGNRSIFIGVHYTVPLLLGGTAAVCATAFMSKRRNASVFARAIQQFMYLVLFNSVIWLHFHIKMWIPLINSNRFDDLYYRSDHLLLPILNLFVTLRQFIASLTGNIDGLYMGLFILMFAVSFFIHSAFDRGHVRGLIIASMLVQAVGSLCYLIVPAVGPFIFEQGMNVYATKCQSSMWEGYQALVASGPGWLSGNAPSYFTAGLAAMPSLHAGASWVFLYYAFKYKPYLLTVYIPIFFWIVIEAVASKWHYLIDLPVGILLAAACIWMANRLEDKRY